MTTTKTTTSQTRTAMNSVLLPLAAAFTFGLAALAGCNGQTPWPETGAAAPIGQMRQTLRPTGPVTDADCEAQLDGISGPSRLSLRDSGPSAARAGRRGVGPRAKE